MKFEIVGQELVKYNPVLGEKKVEIPNGIEKIGDRAFKECQLEEVIIPESVTEIGKESFLYCSNLHIINIPNTVKKIGMYAFYYCNVLTSVTLSNGLTELSKGIFYSCAGLQSIIIPESVKVIGEGAFKGCSALKSVRIPDSVKELGAWAFSSCDHLEAVTIPNGITRINEYTFWYCSRLNSVTLPDSVTEIGERAFEEAICLKTLTLPKGLKKIGREAFANNTALTEFTIPEDVTEIEQNIFWGCNYLSLIKNYSKCLVKSGNSELTIISPNISINEYSSKKAAMMGYIKNRELYSGEIEREYQAFLLKSKYKSVIFENDLVDLLALFAEGGKITPSNYKKDYLEPAQQANAKACVLYISSWVNDNFSKERLEKEELRQMTKASDNAVDMKKIWQYEQDGSGGVILTKYKGGRCVIPDTIAKKPVTEIRGAFNLEVNYIFVNKNIVIPNSVRKIGDKSFNQQHSLENITIPEGVEEIGDECFAECNNLKSVSIPKSLVEIGTQAFRNCSGLKDIYIPESVLILSSKLFIGCNITVHTPKGSIADIYCRRHGIEVKNDV